MIIVFSCTRKESNGEALTMDVDSNSMSFIYSDILAPDCDFLRSIGELCEEDIVDDVDEYLLFVLNKPFDTSYVFSYKQYGENVFYSLRYTNPFEVRFIPLGLNEEINQEEFPLIFKGEYGVLNSSDKKMIDSLVTQIIDGHIDDFYEWGGQGFFTVRQDALGYQKFFGVQYDDAAFDELNVVFKRFICPNRYDVKKEDNG